MDLDHEDVVPSGNPRRRGAVTIGGASGGGHGDSGGGGDGGSEAASNRRMSRKMSSNLKSIWIKMANSSSNKAGTNNSVPIRAMTQTQKARNFL